MTALQIVKDKICEKDWYEINEVTGAGVYTFSSKESTMFLPSHSNSFETVIKTVEWLINNGYINITVQ